MNLRAAEARINTGDVTPQEFIMIFSLREMYELWHRMNLADGPFTRSCMEAHKIDVELLRRESNICKNDKSGSELTQTIFDKINDTLRKSGIEIEEVGDNVDDTQETNNSQR